MEKERRERERQKVERSGRLGSTGNTGRLADLTGSDAWIAARRNSGGKSPEKSGLSRINLTTNRLSVINPHS
ncbi:hypothetical protein KFK09_024839 [Dendrobium nobile]|uniref:Uncharacterized protein n=1 Tax=Dendrobium nobile TaxID=94219 RepID=A0A8T3ADQ6_DENNO|nr:hypothetical protein KFK09_024839 [Dendrobium nobile]